MSPRRSLILASCACLTLVSSCAPGVSGSGGGQATEISSDLTQVKMPVLRSTYFEKAWGAPNIAVMSDGTYRLRYRQGTTLNFVIIEGLTQMEPAPEKAPDWEEPHEDPEGTTPVPAPHHQSWKQTSILGRPVKWYQQDGGSGADFPAYRTVDFTLTAADGRTGFYHITLCSDTTAKAVDWIHRVNW